MSGTSADGIDGVLIKFSENDSQLIGSHFRAMPRKLRDNILKFHHRGFDELHRLATLDRLLGQEFARCAMELLSQANLNPKQITAIGSHGQTLRHYPAGDVPYTVQIGDPNEMVENTGITVVSDFRRRDIAAGGQGAPLVPPFHRAHLVEPGISTAVINIGGISNLTHVTKNGTISGWDIGPGNTLLDLWTRCHLEKPYDNGGEWASTGELLTDLLSRLLADPYFSLSGPKSTGPEYFDASWLDKCLTGNEKPADVQRTLSTFTSECIASDLRPIAPEVVRVCGGGALNPVIMRDLASLLSPATVTSTDVVGLPPEWVEAYAFAWLAKQTIDGNPGNEPKVTGADGYRVLGGIYPG